MSIIIPAGFTEEALATIGLSPKQRAQVTRRGPRKPISFLARQLVFKRDHWTCKVCGAFPYANEPSRRSGALHLDHIIPWSAGGSDLTFNLRTLCGPCNEERSNFVTGQEQPATPIVRICAPCILMDGTPRPEQAFTVYCGCRHHECWALPGWHIL